MRVAPWSGNGHGPKGDRVKRIVDLQAGCAMIQRSFMLVLGLGDAHCWGLVPASGACVAWGALASLAAALGLQRAPLGGA
eukprot:1101858-Pyramimonas_sp.AAC.1